jgi:hypothetical protein
MNSSVSNSVSYYTGQSDQGLIRLLDSQSKVFNDFMHGIFVKSDQDRQLITARDLLKLIRMFTLLLETSVQCDQDL